MKSRWWTTCLFLISPLLAESDSVTIQSSYSSFGSNGQFKELQNKTQRLRCTPTVETSPSQQCRQLAEVLTAARTAARVKPSNWLGITPEWLAANVDQAVKDLKKDLPGFNVSATPAQIALFRTAFLDPKTVAGVEKVQLDSEPAVHIEVKSGNKIKVELRSTRIDPSMAPWSVRLGVETFEAYDRSIGDALCPLIPEAFPNRSLICGTYLRYEYSDLVFAKIYDQWKLVR